MSDNGSAPVRSGKNAAVNPEPALAAKTTKTATTMKKLFGRRKEPEQVRAVQLPENGFDHPFQDTTSRYWRFRGKELPRTTIELRMCTLSSYIRERPNWWEEAKDKGVVEQWRKDILRQQEAGDEIPSRKLTPAMVNYVLKELQGYASLRDPVTGIEVGPAERVWKSDRLIPVSLRDKLLAAVAPLEAVPDSERDWHPGSYGFVHNLAHPSLYPIVFGRTMGKVTGSDTTTVLSPPEIKNADPMYVSQRFQWIPSDFSVGGDGKVTLTSPYINNIHPTRDKELYVVIPEILQRALPMFERVLSDLLQPLLPTRIATSPDVRGPRGPRIADCIWKNGIHYPNPTSEEDYYKNKDTLYAGHELRIPDVRGKYDGDLQAMKNQISLKGRTIQIFVKLANIVLTPERPEYPGGKWHVEGMRNEMIVSSFVYYYDSDNITESKLSFRRATYDPQTHGRDDDFCSKVLYDMDRDSPCVQVIGDVITKTGRSIAFPNLYQHQVQPFRLTDPTKPGHRKILVFFLVDPTQRVLSATNVAPQQREWVTDAMYQAGQNSAFAKLPIELLTLISSENEGAMTRMEAEKYRAELMSERIAAGEENGRTYFGRVRPRLGLGMLD